MKIYSLLVCFFVVFNSTITTVSIENKVAEIEKKIDSIDESQAIRLSQDCQDLNNSIQESCLRLEIEKEKLKHTKNEKNKIYNKKRNNMKLMMIMESENVKKLQNKTDYFLSFDLNKKLKKLNEELRISNREYKKCKKEYLKVVSLYNEHIDWTQRLTVCQEKLFIRYKNLRGMHDEMQSFSENKTISGNERLPSYGSIENIDESGISCLNGNYQIDNVSDFWIFPVENGTISASTWYYPGGGLHLGMDLASSMYSNVYACGNGLILYADACVDSNNGYLGNWCGWPNGGGNTICMIVAMYDGLYAVSYNHLSNQIFVSSGQQVKQSDRIALSGNSGNSSGPHTHIEVFRLKQDLQTVVDYFKEGADFSFGCGWNKPATCSQYACRIEPSEVLEGV